MTQADYAAAKRYALDKLEHDLPEVYLYHSLFHTRDDVLVAAGRLAKLEGLNAQETLLVKTAALYHDVGFTRQFANHEEVGAEIAEGVLPGFGYAPEQLGHISAMILATKIPQRSATKLEQILADADLDVFGRDDFLARNELLFQEHCRLLKPLTKAAWYEQQVAFLERHSYFTVSARALRDEKKRRNIRKLEDLLAKA